MEPWNMGVGFVLIQHQPVNDYPYPQPFQLQTLGKPKWVRQPEGFAPSEPSFRLDRTEVEILFNQLWLLGFRPTETINEASRLAATQAHLADMRAITFAKLNIEPPQEKLSGR
jgi:hypothetical protein